MSQTVTIEESKLNQIIKTLNELKKEVARLSEKVDRGEPAYGSDAWWEWSDKKAMEDVKAGKVMKFKSAEEAIEWLNS